MSQHYLKKCLNCVLLIKTGNKSKGRDFIMSKPTAYTHRHIKVWH